MEQVENIVKLLPHQTEGVDFIQSHKHSYIAFDMGLGKTFTAIYPALYFSDSYTLIVCPAYLKYNWKTEIMKMGVREHEIQIGESRKDKFEFKRFIITSYDAKTIKNILVRSIGFRMVIFDEAHYLRGKGAQRTKVCLGSDSRLKHTIDKYCAQCVFLSGSPLLHRPAELWPILRMVYPKHFASWDQYIFRYCDAYYGERGLDYSGASNLEELKPFLDAFILRKTKDQVLDLPNKGINMVELDVDKEVQKYLNQESDLGISVDNLLGEVVIGEYATVRRELGLLKSKIAKEFIEDIRQNGEDVVVFTYHKELAHILSDNPITGETPLSKRQTIVDNFQIAGGVIVGTFGAMGTGFTLTKACNVVLVELEYSPLLNQQAIDRLHRIGQTRKVTAHVLLWSSGLERDLFRNLKKKRKTFDTLFGE